MQEVIQAGLETLVAIRTSIDHLTIAVAFLVVVIIVKRK
jgi:hypothetical protein